MPNWLRKVADPANLFTESDAERAAREQSGRQVDLAIAEEARRAELRKKIAMMFGEGPETEQVQVGTNVTPVKGREFDKPDIEQIFETRPTTVPAAKAQFATEEGDLAGALRGHYGDELQRNYAEQERQNRFGAARTGNIGGSAFADSRSSLEEQNRLGGTRIDEAVQRAINTLRSSREQTKLRAIDLVNAGSGEEGVQSATAGLKSSLEQAKAANREQLFGDLFTSGAFANANRISGDRNAQALAIFGNSRGGGLSPSSRNTQPRIIN